jgi:hypothetical protein
MAIANYTDLKAAVASWLNRSDLTAVIPDFITLAESDIERDLRAATTREALTLNSAAVSLPATCEELRSVRLNTTVYQQALEIVTPEHLADYRQVWAGATARPQWGSVVNGVLLLAPTPDQSYTAEIVYFTALIPLSGAVATNIVLPSAPDIYLYGALKHAEVYLEHDEKAMVYQTLFDAAIEKENLKRERQEYGGKPGPMRLPVVFG